MTNSMMQSINETLPFGYNVTVYKLSESLATLAENGPEATLSPHVFEKLLKVHSPVAKELFFRYRTILVCMYVCIQYIYIYNT